MLNVRKVQIKKNDKYRKKLKKQIQDWLDYKNKINNRKTIKYPVKWSQYSSKKDV
jgi:hypothetical protein